jgi:energy-coupling factor transport system permease protein
VPGALYEVGVAVVVALSFSPQLVEQVSRVRSARRLRGRAHRGLRGLRGVAMPVLEGALERSIDLAAAMDARGFGRAGGRAGSSGGTARNVAGALTLAGLLGVCAGLYGLLDAGSPVLLGLPLLVAGTALAGVGLSLGSRRAARSRYRPDVWGGPEWLVTLSGAVAAAAGVAGSALYTEAAYPSTSPLVAPALPVLQVLGVLVAVLPAWLAPVPEPDRDDERDGGGHARVDGDTPAAQAVPDRTEVPA